MTHQSLQLVAWGELAVCWLAWFLSHVLHLRRRPASPHIFSAAAGWLGILLCLAGLACLAVPFRPAGYLNPIATIIPAMVIAPLSVGLVWSARKHLGRHWRPGAVVDENHELVKTGPYARMRHPIYASLLGMVVATAFAWSWWPLGTTAAILTLFGIELRAKAEEHILSKLFQDEFIEYEARTRAFFPF